MSQIALNKTFKEEYIKLIINYLWKGNTIAAVLILKFMNVKNQTKREELIGYSEKMPTILSIMNNEKPLVK